MINERTIIDNITVLEDGQIQVRRADIIERDGVEIARNFHRHVISPGQDISGEDEKVRRVAGAIHTKAVVDAFREAVLARIEL
tara:strand:- start:31 stop:279 length:249 start_codon:yes stop_codon:yes gene_type:complete